MKEDEEKSIILGNGHISPHFKINILMLSARDLEVRYSSDIASSYHLKVKSAPINYKLQNSD